MFHAYDIRGLSPGELDEAFAERFGRVLSDIYSPKCVMVGRDMRTTSPVLETALIKGLTEQGVDVVRIGLCSTPVFNVNIGLANGAYDLGVMVTASHNPGEYNGFKLTDGNVYTICQGNGMEELRDRYVSDDPFPISDHVGTIQDDPDAVKRYLDRVFSLVDTKSIAPQTVAIDAGNGMAGVVLPAFFERLPQVKVLPLYWEPDGTFPNHEANPLKLETLKDLSALVQKERCAFGVAFDGDCDRIGFMDEEGTPVRGDIMTGVLAIAALETHPGSTILFDVRASWAVQDAIEDAGGKVGMTPVGHSFIKKQARESNALFAGELSSHFYFRDLWSVESGDLAMLIMLLRAGKSGKPFSSLWKSLDRYAYSGEINSTVNDKDAVLRRIEETYVPKASSVSKLDGLRVEFDVAPDGAKGTDAWWFSVRSSNTEPLLRLIVEAVREDLMVEKRDELLALIRA